MKQYTITGPRWSSQHLQIQQDGTPVLFVNANNKYDPWKDPYITIHQERSNGEIVAAAKMGSPGWARNFKVWLGNPDCTDLNTWPVVECRGKSAFEYRFWVGERELAWRRTRRKELGVKGKGHRDFKLVYFERPEVAEGKGVGGEVVRVEECLLDIDNDEDGSAVDDTMPQDEQKNSAETCEKADERVIAVYYMDTHFKSNSREAKIDFFEELSKETELWCLTVVLGLQEKISKNQDVMRMSSYSYGGGLWWIGNYI